MKYIKKFQDNTALETYKKSNFVSPHIYLDSNLNTVKFMQEYVELEYISSTQTGGQYIDLGCHLLENTDDIRIDIKFNIKGRGLNSANQQGTLIGSQPEVSPYPGFVLRYQNTNNAYLHLQAKWFFTGSLNNSGKGVSKYLSYPNHNVVDNNIYEFSETLDNIPQDQVNDCTCTLFCALDGSNNPFRFVEADLYYLRFIKGGQVIRNLIPVKKVSTNEIGLYDIENDHFYISKGDEPFVAEYKHKNDNIIHNISYLQGSGTQWIDTLIHPTTGYGFELYGGFTSFNNNEFFGGGNSWSNGLGICTHKEGKYGIIVGSTEVCQISSVNNVMHLFKVNSDGTVYVDNEYKGQSTTEIPDGNYTMNIFKYSTNNNPRMAKIYYCKIFNNNNELVFDGIPVRKNEIGYMYDKVTNKLFENCGTGEFILGPDI